MDIRKVMLLAVLVLLLAVCFLSDRIAGRLGQADEKTMAKRSLMIKLGALAAVVILYLVTFLA